MKKILAMLIATVTLMSISVSADTPMPKGAVCPECLERETHIEKHKITQLIEWVPCVHGGFHGKDGYTEYGTQYAVICPKCGKVGEWFVGDGIYYYEPWAGC